MTDYMGRKTSGTSGPPHDLVIEDAPGEEHGKTWRIEHLESCPREVYTIDPEGRKIEVEKCAVGAYEAEFGLEMLGPWYDLPAGRYQLEAWWTRYPSTPNHPEEWDGGLQLVGDWPPGPGEGRGD